MAFDHLDDGKFADERTALAAALAARPLSPQDRDAVRVEAEALVRGRAQDRQPPGRGRELPAGVQPVAPARAWR